MAKAKGSAAERLEEMRAERELYESPTPDGNGRFPSADPEEVTLALRVKQEFRAGGFVFTEGSVVDAAQVAQALESRTAIRDRIQNGFFEYVHDGDVMDPLDAALGNEDDASDDGEQDPPVVE